MGFAESFNQGFDKESGRLARERENMEELEEIYDGYEDGTLLKKVRYAFGEDKRVIERILKRRGYRKNANGIYDRR